jgi:hypothetical protein
MRDRSRWILAAASLMWIAAPASADPITAVYDVHVQQRGLYVPGNVLFAPFDQRFALRMTFDPAGAVPDSNGLGIFGVPSFSPVPLPIVAPPENMTLEASGFTFHDEGTLAAQAAMAGRNAEWIFSSAVRFSGQMIPGSAMTPENFAAGLTRFQLFGFLQATANNPAFPEGAFAPGSLNYLGVASLVAIDPAPVPEPGTLALVGGALGWFARRRVRLRARQT